jgi:diguanylate cyclase (GGDEF)-like protein
LFITRFCTVLEFAAHDGKTGAAGTEGVRQATERVRSKKEMTRILCVDDDAMVRNVISTVLKMEGWEVEQATNGFAALEVVAAREPDLIVLDVEMPRLGGLDVCRELKRNPFTARIPILMLTGLGEINNKLHGFEAGADDYLAKPFDARELRARTSALLRLVRRESDRNPSSGLPGGRATREEIERRAAQSNQSGEPFAIVYIDLDHFKPFADHFGFGAADAVIEATGAVLSDALRARGTTDSQADDFAGHIGGDDFLLITAPENAESLTRDVQARFASAVAKIVDDAQAPNGFFSAPARNGEMQTFPLGGMTAVILVVAPDRWKSVAHLGAFAASQKALAKAGNAGTQRGAVATQNL